jgi:uncharacterized membrane protein YeiH
MRPVSQSYQVPLAIDLAAVAVGAVGGTLTGLERRGTRTLDLLGVLALALVLGFGGGVVRDVLLGQTPAALLSNSYILTVIVATSATLVVASHLHRASRLVAILDEAVVGLYAAIAAIKADEAGLSLLGIGLLATLAGVGGGVLRDLLLGDTPSIMRPGELYAVPAGIGVVALMAAAAMGAPVGAQVALATAVCVGLRELSLALGWETKPAYLQTPRWRAAQPTDDIEDPPAPG